MATLLFKTYIKVRTVLTCFRQLLIVRVFLMQLRSTALCKNLIRGIGAADLAPFQMYPLSHQVSLVAYVLPGSR